MDLRQKVFGDQDSLKHFLSSIPGYAGYQQKELRREADKLLRNHIATKLSEEQRRLNEQKVQLVSGGQLLSIGPIERASTKLQHLSDRIRTATYGYAGWFDAVSVQESDLDALYEFDNSLLESVSHVTEAISKLATTIAERSNIAVSANELITVADELNAQVSRRQDLLVEGKRPPKPALDVLEPKLTSSARAMELASLKLNDAVTNDGVDYVVAGKVSFSDRGHGWNTFQIKDNQTEHWLWVGDAGNTVGLLTPVSLGADVAGLPSVTVEGEEFKLALRGSAQASVEGPSGKRSGIFVDYWSFTSSSDRLL